MPTGSRWEFRVFGLSKDRVARIKRGLLAFDSWIDHTIWSIWPRVLGGWDNVVAFFDRFRVRGWRKGLFELLGQAMTLGTIGAIGMLALAIPAFQATTDDWLNRGDISVTFLDRNGAEIGRRGLFQNDSIPLSDYPDNLIKATLATEDRRFYQHFGIDIPGTIRAMAENARAKTVVQGGSSLSQQLAKNIFLSNERTLERKVKEAFLALWLEARLTKQEILKLYLDRAYLGGGAFGVDAASRFYFGKSARDVTLAESAMLAGLFKAPTKYAPHVNLAAARGRANVVLDNLVNAGFLTEGQVQGARANPATPVATQGTTAPDYYLDWAFNEVKKQAEEGAFKGQRVLTVRTALDPGIQKQAESVVETILRQYGTQYRVHQAAAVFMEPEGAVRAMIGGRDYGTSQFNRATDAMRQPGSSFKTYVYATAMEHGRTPATIILDAPISIGNWSPQNYGRSYAGRIPLITAFAKSINTPPVRLAQEIGRDKIVEMAHRMGIKSELKITRSLPLGASEVTVLEHTSAYASLANGGFRIEPYATVEVRDGAGEVLWRHDRDARPAIPALGPDVVASMNKMMLAVVENGTGRRALIDGFQVGGKTGTSQNYRDAWFVGFTGNMVGGVWMGNDDYTGTNEMTGGSLPAMTWNQVMTYAHKGLAPRQIPGVAPPAPVVAKRDSKPTQAVDPAAPHSDLARSTLSPAAVQRLVEISRDLEDAERALGTRTGDSVSAITIRGSTILP
jgi:penicillin-binding protein 1A